MVTNEQQAMKLRILQGFYLSVFVLNTMAIVPVIGIFVGWWAVFFSLVALGFGVVILVLSVGAKITVLPGVLTVIAAGLGVLGIIIIALGAQSFLFFTGVFLGLSSAIVHVISAVFTMKTRGRIKRKQQDLELYANSFSTYVD
ncbi:MAG: hypothetical protein ACRC6X_01975 [Culicoidibacterales bacterium]